MHSSLPSGFPCGSAGKESACSEGDLGSIPGLGRSPEEGKGYALQRSDLESSVDCIVHGVTKSRTRLSDFHFTSLLKIPTNAEVYRIKVEYPLSKEIHTILTLKDL